MSASFQAPDDVPRETPSVARIYDYYLGGYHNFAADRRVAEAAIAIYPDLPLIMQANRAFLRRAVRFCLDQGITQFLDLGSGIPTVGNVHEVAHGINPRARVVYVDIDPVAVTHSAALLADNPHATIIQADALQPAAVFSHPDLRRLIDGRQPLAVLLLAILHFVPDDAAAGAIAHGVQEALAPGSYMALSHATYDGVSQETVERVETLYARNTNPLKARSQAQLTRFFDGLELVAPGLVHTPAWRPEGADDLFLDQPERACAYAGVGHKL